MDVCENIARIIDPALAAELDAGALNQWGRENWSIVLGKAAQIITIVERARRTPEPFFCHADACRGLDRCPRDPVCND